MEYLLKKLHNPMRFKEYILEESDRHLDQRISDILSALQDLNDSSENMGARHLVSNSEGIVKQIRRTVHTHWPEREEPRLKTLQKCGVAIMRAIDEKDDLEAVLKACQSNLEGIAGDSRINEV